MLCHQQEYKRKKVNGVFVPDTALMTITMDEAVQTVHRPERANCLQCHAKAGGGDAVKRGDITLAHAATTRPAFDVHMATTGADLACQSCHTFTDHRVSGRGSDLRVTDSTVPMDCADCHADMAAARSPDRPARPSHRPGRLPDLPHPDLRQGRQRHRGQRGDRDPPHLARHPRHRAALPPGGVKANDLTPAYRFWNRYSDNYLLGDDGDARPGHRSLPHLPARSATSPTRRSKLYPFKYKTAEQPMATSTGQLIALDTSVFFATADPAAATEQGLVNMGLSAHEPYAWVETDTFQLLSHEVSPHEQALQCVDCHGTTAAHGPPGRARLRAQGPDPDRLHPVPRLRRS